MGTQRPPPSAVTHCGGAQTRALAVCDLGLLLTLLRDLLLFFLFQELDRAHPAEHGSFAALRPLLALLQLPALPRPLGRLVGGLVPTTRCARPRRQCWGEGSCLRASPAGGGGRGARPGGLHLEVLHGGPSRLSPARCSGPRRSGSLGVDLTAHAGARLLASIPPQGSPPRLAHAGPRTQLRRPAPATKRRGRSPFPGALTLRVRVRVRASSSSGILALLRAAPKHAPEAARACLRTAARVSAGMRSEAVRAAGKGTTKEARTPSSGDSAPARAVSPSWSADPSLRSWRLESLPALRSPSEDTESRDPIESREARRERSLPRLDCP